MRRFIGDLPIMMRAISNHMISNHEIGGTTNTKNKYELQIRKINTKYEIGGTTNTRILHRNCWKFIAGTLDDLEIK